MRRLCASLLLLAGAVPAGAAQRIEHTDQAVELSPPSPAGALEADLAGPVRTLYAAAIRALRAGRQREALPLLREARALAWLEYQNGPGPRPLSYRRFVRVVYLEEQVSDLLDQDRQLARLRERMTAEDRAYLQHERALILHNLFLAVRSFTGQTDERMLRQTLDYYEDVLARSSPLRTVAQVAYAGLLAERGDRRAARAALSHLTADEQAAERCDLAMAYYHLALGDAAMALSRLQVAAQRDSWDHPSAGQDGRSVRGMVYRMNDFDRLRDHPRFREMVTVPEEALR